MNAEQVTQGLTRTFAARGDGGSVEAAAQLTGGASMETWAFTLRTNDGARPLILRRRDAARAASSSGYADLAAEAMLLEAARKAGVPVPAVVAVCGAEAGLGEAYVMERVEGETLGRRIVRDARFAAVRPRLAAQCGAVMAAIHAADPGEAPLETTAAAAVIARYEAIYRQLDDPRAPLEAGFRFLERRAPPLERAVLVHGDFRNGNLIIDADRGLVAVLDWELAHRGDPAEDLGWICVNSWRFGAGDRPVGGFGDYADLLDAYRTTAGWAPPLEHVLVWQAIGSLKWAVMCQMMSAAAPGSAPPLERAVIGRRVSEAEIDLVTLMARLA